MYVPVLELTLFLPPPVTEAGPPPEVPNVVFLNHMVFGDTAEFVCVITGYPIPRIQWYHNDELVTGDDGRTNVEVFPNGAQQMKLAVSTLTILGVVGSDSGSYRCTGDNSAGNVSSVVELEVTGSGDMQKRSVRSVDESAQALMCDLDSSNTGMHMRCSLIVTGLKIGGGRVIFTSLSY